MKIITKLSELGLVYPTEWTDNPTDADWDAFKKDVIAGITDAFDSEKHYENTHLLEYPEFWVIHYGIKEPDFVKNVAENWNDEIKTEFCNCVNKVFDEPKSIATLHMRDDSTYNMMTAAMELQDHWSDFANHGVYLKNECGIPYFRCILEGGYEDDILSNPAEYIVATTYPKDG